MEPVPPEAAVLGVCEGNSWATAIASAIQVASGNVAPRRSFAKSRTPHANDVEFARREIDYAAGQSAKQLLMKKLGVTRD